ncbi:LEA type 2 family protein [Metapseudomonas resinovorans]|uniref:Water stress and hypersensitive response domain-containing protein n=1 Tax=Metapseudomonas resinovorans NBRC 106553 TaxID=1245471 RepID=S6AWK2_METRE|nr:LEA type 2 family protein [Pseudomonas resinovorans]BAN50748.1 hypothetical protein PCA10_50160 [Pseudomonas resinovorans NBRC 106553]
MRTRQFAPLLFALALLGGCAVFTSRDPVRVDLASLEPLPGEGLEVRFKVRLRVQNPNAGPIHFNGVSLELDLNDLPLASGVSDQSGTLAGFSERLIEVPVTLSAFSVLRQTWNLADGYPVQSVPYAMRGKLGGGLWGSRHFSDAGLLSIP